MIVVIVVMMSIRSRILYIYLELKSIVFKRRELAEFCYILNMSHTPQYISRETNAEGI